MIGLEISTRFFKMITAKRIPEAEQELQKIRTKLDQSKDSLGYLRALEGLVLTEKSGDKSLFLNRIPINQETVKQIRREFMAHASNELHEDYDRAYFQALADYFKIIEDEKIWDQVSKRPERKLEDEIQKRTGTPEL
jgi:hypothetical protein